MNVCIWPVFYPSKAGVKFQIMPGNREIHKAQTIIGTVPSASVNRQRRYDEARWASQMCLEPHETAAVDDGTGSAQGSLEIAAPVVNDPTAGGDVDDSQVR